MTDTTLIGMKGIIAKLLAETDLTDIVSTRIYSNVPQQADFPYAFVEFASSDWSQKDDTNMSHIVTIHGYSRKSSILEVSQIAEKVYNALNRQESNITLDSGTVVLLQFTNVKTVFKESDGVTWHSVIEFEFIID